MKLLLSICFLTIFLFSCKSDDPISPKSNDKFIEIQNYLDSAWSAYVAVNSIPDGAGVAMYISVNREYQFFKTHLDESVTENSHFRIANNTKIFTAAAIMLLHQQGKLNINDKIIDIIPYKNKPYIPKTPNFNLPFKDRITIKQLLQHIAGVYDVFIDDIPDTVKQDYKGQNYITYMLKEKGAHYSCPIDELIGVVAATKLYYFEPGIDFHYSNTGYQVLAKIIEEVTGMTYTDFITEALIQRNGLTSTYSVWRGDDVKLPTTYIPGYVFSDNNMYEYTEENHSIKIAEGNIVSTPADMVTWIKLLINGKAGISAENINIMKDYTDNPFEKYGLGLLSFDGLGIGHNGITIGYLSYCIYNPEKDIALCLVSNLWNLNDNINNLNQQLSFLERICKEAIKKL